jgi:hypothetical protein
MKIEIGESLVYSWLRHVKQCQIVQTNWKPSPKWWRNSIDFEPIIADINNVLQNLDLDIFGNNNIEQFFRQAEIDVLGVSNNQENIPPLYYFIDVAFHEGGLNYGDSNETISRVLKKFIRSYFIFKSYFGDSENGSFFFISPKASVQNAQIPINARLVTLSEIFITHGFAPNFKFIVNDDFKNEVLIPTMNIANEVADTNELFLRSVQLWRMFEGTNQQGHVRNEHRLRRDVNTIREETGINANNEVIAIGRFVRGKIDNLIHTNSITPLEVGNLLDSNYCNRVFSSHFPVLRNIGEGRDDRLGRPRYYAHPISIFGVNYYLCNDWFERQRIQFQTWLVGLAR